MKLLQHPFYNVRLGAWTGLGFYAKAGTVEKLVAEFAKPAVLKKPFYRQALYRAIDNSLITLEVKGDEADLERLDALWRPFDSAQGPEAGPTWTIPGSHAPAHGHLSGNIGCRFSCRESENLLAMERIRKSSTILKIWKFK